MPRTQRRQRHVPDIQLRPWHPQDAAALAALFDDDLVYRFTPIQPPFDEAAARARIRIAAGAEKRGAVLCRAVVAGGAPVGEVAAYSRGDPDTGEKMASVSYVIGRAYRGCGFARPALELLIASAGEAWECTRFLAEISPDNAPSVRVAESLGFVLDAMAEPVPCPGKDYSVVPWFLQRPLPS